jgi:hypothetical protein
MHSSENNKTKENKKILIRTPQRSHPNDPDGKIKKLYDDIMSVDEKEELLLFCYKCLRSMTYNGDRY